MASRDKPVETELIPRWPHVQVRIHPDKYRKLRVYLFGQRKTVREFFGEWLDKFIGKIPD